MIETRRDATTGWLRPDAAKFKIQNLAAPRGQILNFEFWRKSDDGDRPTNCLAYSFAPNNLKAEASCRRPKNIKNVKIWKMSKWKSSKTHHFRRFQPKRTSPSFSAHFFTYYSTGQNYFSTFFRIWHFFDIRIIKNYIFLRFGRLGTMRKRFFEAKSLRLHISNPK